MSAVPPTQNASGGDYTTFASEQRSVDTSLAANELDFDFKNLNLHDVNAEDFIHTSLNASHFLNETLCVRTLLRSVDLECYAAGFEESGVDLEQFLALKLPDLERLGVQSPRHCHLILELIDAFCVESDGELLLD